jgi:hypothetical protein
VMEGGDERKAAVGGEAEEEEQGVRRRLGLELDVVSGLMGLRLWFAKPSPECCRSGGKQCHGWMY